MQDLRKEYNKKSETNIVSTITKFFIAYRYVMMWILIGYITVNILFYPVRSALTIAKWYNDFVVTIKTNTK